MKVFTAVLAIVLCGVRDAHVNPGWNNWVWPGHTNPRVQLRCPAQTEYGDDQRLSSVALNYPVDGVTSELLARPVLFNCLKDQVVLPSDAMVPYDPVIGTAVSTCPTTEHKLWSYISPINNGRCWILQNFQEPIHYVSCLTKVCRNCSNYSKYQGTYTPTYQRRTTSSQQLCLKIYRYIQVYAYCENLALNARIVVERLIAPKDCSCRAVQCYGTWK